jgi:ParB/RepB/Spo0J family partition protein
MDTIVLIDAKSIASSPLNPRKVVDQNSIIELSESIKSVGLLQPVTLRPVIDKDDVPTDGYELVLGSRRLAAMKLLGWESIPSIIKDLDDDEVLEAMIIENLQRKDIEPLDEAKAFNELHMKGMAYVDIAAKVGKSPEFVKLRIKLNELIPEFQTLLSDNKMSLAAAHEICKVISEIQIAIYEQHYAEGIAPEQRWDILTINELKEKLSKQFIPLSSAEFNLSECQGCVYNTTGVHSLFNEYNGNNCTNVSCFQTKKQEHIIGIIKECIANEIPIIVKASAERMINQLKELGIEEPILYLSSNYDLVLYPETDDDNEIDMFDEQSVKFGYTRAYSIGMIKEGIKYLYFKEKEKVEESITEEQKVPENPSKVVSEAIKEEANEIDKLKKKDERNLELRNEKIIEETRDMFSKSEYRDNNASLHELENNAFIACVLYLCSNTKIKEITDHFDKNKTYMENVSNLTVEDRNIIKRCFIKQLIVGASVTGNKEVQSILLELSSQFYATPFLVIATKHDAEYQKRKERLDTRIKIINGEKEPAKKRESKADKVKPDTYKPKKSKDEAILEQ